MPPKKITTKTVVGGDGKSRPVFEPDYASAREKRLSMLRQHATRQFDYRGIAQPSLSIGTTNTFDDDNDDSSQQQQQQQQQQQYDQDIERLYVHAVDTQDKGRILIADMAFKPGDIIFRERPLATATWDDHLCHECAQPHQYSSCRQFKGIYSTGIDTKDNDGNIIPGKPITLMKRMNDLEDALMMYDIVGDIDRARLFIKLVWLHRLCPEAQCWIELDKLTTAGTRENEYLQCIQEFAAKRVVKETTLIDGIPLEKLARLLAILNNNSHEVEDFGSGIWLYASLLEHSCNANCNFVTTPDELILVALSDIPIGTSLTIDYNVTTYKPQSIRQAAYRSHYGFTCTCDMCTRDYDKPRAFYCPQTIRYFASFAKANQLNTFTFGQFAPETMINNATTTTNSIQQSQQQQQHIPLQHPIDQNGNNIINDVNNYRTQFMSSKLMVSDSTKTYTNPYQQQRRTIHPVSSMYSFDGIQFDINKCPFLTVEPNPTSKTTNKCINGIVYPIGDGTNNNHWKCSGCGYILSPEEVAICLSYESKIQPPPSITTGDSDDLNELESLFDFHNYSLPTFGQINDCLSYGVLNFSHSSIYWTLYVLALKWTKTATDACYALETTALKQKAGISTTTTTTKAKKGTKKGIKSRGANQQQLHKITLSSPEDTLTENELNEQENQLRQILQFFNINYQPLQHTTELYQKQFADSVKSVKNGMNEENDKTIQQQFKPSEHGITTIAKHIELPLLCEHLWTLIAEGVTMNLHPLHPELLIIYDYLAQIQILKRRSKRAKYIWLYCYELSKVINTTLTKETYKLKRLVQHTPQTIAQLQHHYSTIQKLYDQLQFHQEDMPTQLLTDFMLTGIESDSEDEKDENEQNNNGIIGPNQQQGNMGTQNGDNDENDDDDDDADSLLLQSSFAKTIVKQAQQHQANTKQQIQMNEAQGMVSDPHAIQKQQQSQQQQTLTNSFGFSASVLFSTPATTTTTSTPTPTTSTPIKSTTPNVFNNFTSPQPNTFSTPTLAFNTNVTFTSTTPTSPTQPQQQQPLSFGSTPSTSTSTNPFGSTVTFGNTAFGTSSTPLTNNNNTTTTTTNAFGTTSSTTPFTPNQPFVFSPGKPSQTDPNTNQQQSSLPTDPFSRIKFGNK